MKSTIMSDSEDDAQPLPPITVTQPGPHTNELLCYVVCKLHICTFDIIVKLCTDFYSLDDVREARELLSNCTVLPDGDRRINRRAANCKEVHMKDIVAILLEVRPVDMPVFLAKKPQQCASHVLEQLRYVAHHNGHRHHQGANEGDTSGSGNCFNGASSTVYGCSTT